MPQLPKPTTRFDDEDIACIAACRAEIRTCEEKLRAAHFELSLLLDKALGFVAEEAA